MEDEDEDAVVTGGGIGNKAVVTDILVPGCGKLPKAVALARSEAVPPPPGFFGGPDGVDVAAAAAAAMANAGFFGKAMGAFCEDEDALCVKGGDDEAAAEAELVVAADEEDEWAVAAVGSEVLVVVLVLLLLLVVSCFGRSPSIL